MKNKKPLYVDLFCGSGGFSLGFDKAGFTNVFSVEYHPEICKTYRHNFPSHNLIECDITQLANETILDLVKDKHVDVVIGGPPCQGFSMAGNIGRRFISTSPFDNSTLEQVCNIFEAHGLNPMVYRRNGNSIEVHHCGQFSPQEQEFVEERMRLSKKFHLNDPAYKINDNEALLIFAMNDYSRLKPIYNDVIKHVNCSSVCYHDIFDPSAGLMETYAPGVSKAVAIRRLADEIGAERLIVFGDNRNDIPMMKIADYAVAPENAIDEVKAIAHEVIGPNYTHSVDQFIASQHTI